MRSDSPTVDIGGPKPPQDRAARRAKLLPPEIDGSKVCQVKSLAGRKQGTKNKAEEAVASETRGGRGMGHKTVTPPEGLEGKCPVVREVKKKIAHEVQKRAAAAAQSPRHLARSPRRSVKKRKCVQVDDGSSESSEPSESPAASSSPPTSQSA